MIDLTQYRRIIAPVHGGREDRDLEALGMIYDRIAANELILHELAQERAKLNQFDIAGQASIDKKAATVQRAIDDFDAEAKVIESRLRTVYKHALATRQAGDMAAGMSIVKGQSG